MATFINHLPETKTIDGREFYRGDSYESERDAAIDRHALKSEYYTRLFWTGGETLSNGSIRKTFFLMVHPRPGKKTAKVTVSQIKADGLDPLPLDIEREKTPLPRFHPIAEIDSERWTDVEIAPVVEDDRHYSRVNEGEPCDCWSVYLRLERGGCACVADLETREQATALAHIIMSGATWFVPAK